jgi:hypothetical protein
LESSTIINFEITKDAFDAVDSLRHLKLRNVYLKEWQYYQQILFKQKALRSLALEIVSVGSFELKDWNIEKLVLKSVMFQKMEVFQTFVTFIKMLSNVSELEIKISKEELQKHSNYKEILEHLLNLPSLTKLKWHSPITENLKIHNPFVKSFFVDTQTGNYSEIFRHFLMIQELEFSIFGYNIDDLSAAMKSLPNLTELKFERINSDLLKAIDCPQIQKISIDGYIWCEDNKVWKQFVERHPNIEYLELIVRNRNNNSEPHYIKYFKNLSNTEVP